jgi:hypothetical protein
VLTVFSGLVRILIILVPARPSRLKATSIPRTRRNVCARRKRPRDRAGVLGPTSGPDRGGRELECGFTFRRELADFHLHVVSSHARTWPRRELVLHRRPKSQICPAIVLAVHTGPWWQAADRKERSLCISTFMTRPNFASIRRRSSHRAVARYCSCFGRARRLVPERKAPRKRGK